MANGRRVYVTYYYKRFTLACLLQESSYCLIRQLFDDDRRRWRPSPWTPCCRWARVTARSESTRKLCSSYASCVSSCQPRPVPWSSTSRAPAFSPRQCRDLRRTQPTAADLPWETSPSSTRATRRVTWSVVCQETWRDEPLGVLASCPPLDPQSSTLPTRHHCRSLEADV